MKTGVSCGSRATSVFRFEDFPVSLCVVWAAAGTLGLFFVMGAAGCSPNQGPGSDGSANDGVDGSDDLGDEVEDSGKEVQEAGDTANATSGETGVDGSGDTGGSGDVDAAGDGRPECENWESNHPNWLWCDGFEGGAALTDVYSDVKSASDGGMGITTDDAYRGSHSIRQHYEKGQVGAGWTSLHIGNAPASDGSISAQRELYVRWYHKFEAGFQGAPPKMARIRHLTPSWDKSTAVHMWLDTDDDDSIVADVYAPNSSQANSSGWLAAADSSFSFSNSKNIGRWVCLEMQVKNNTSGSADGAYRFWADGKKVVERTGVDLTGSSGESFNEIMLDTYWNDGSPKAQNRYYDNFVISTERIGCLE